MSPSVRSSRFTCRANQSSGTLPDWCKSVKIPSIMLACSAWLMPRKSGMRHTSHNKRTDFASLARAMISPDCCKVLSDIRSSASRAFSNHSSSGATSNERISAATVPNSRRELRQFSFLIGVKRCSMIAPATSSDNVDASPVTPKVPWLIPLPARPAIWANSFGANARIRRPSNLASDENATWSISRFSPMPIASVATRKSTSPF